MQLFQVTIEPQSPFATPLRGDTLFGQCCWALRNDRGSSVLEQALEGYQQDAPFMVLSDPLPEGYLPRPSMPAAQLGFDLTDVSTRKAQKGLQWLPLASQSEPLQHWSRHLQPDPVERRQLPRGHNSLNRLTNTTSSGEQGFAPYSVSQEWFAPGTRLHVYALIDGSRCDQTLLCSLLSSVGQWGYGRDASSGRGRFAVLECREWEWQAHSHANRWLTLAPCAPQGQRWLTQHCYYRRFVRYGRHGDRAVQTGRPFKNPVLMADTGAVLAPAEWQIGRFLAGSGLGGVSAAMPGAVQQGYAPVVPVYVEDSP
ncbi:MULTISPECIES: hypothetical protein [Microbulbifer]|uniref:type III-A CRISPR-associated RAMP protein Csm4 n=1 Tax=Microbulbifer TaxID=48073 RepID=UPI0007492C95|nr:MULTISPECIES: hypothetical protein [Microbulbifer]KUJ83443.1 hypothetical protein AVO43_06150 [Microbulbifer sp. ZGT114]